MLSSNKVTKTHISIGSRTRKNKYIVMIIMIDEQTDLDIYTHVWGTFLWKIKIEIKDEDIHIHKKFNSIWYEDKS